MSASTSGKMARKFNRTARDIDRAIAAARLAPLKAFLVQRAREASWTTATVLKVDTVPFRLDIKALAAHLDVRRDTLAECHQWLVAARIFVPAEGHPGLYLISKDFRSWIDPDKGSPLLSEALATDAEGARQFTIKGVQSWASVAVPDRKNPEVAPENSGQDGQSHRKNPETLRKNPEILRKNPAPPIEERARDQSLLESYQSKYTEPRAGESAPLPPTKTTPSEPSPSRTKPGAAAPSPTDAADRIAARISVFFREAPDDNGELYRAEALVWLAHHPEPVVDLALTRAKAASTSGSGRGFCRFVPSFLAKAAQDVGRSSATEPERPKSRPSGPDIPGCRRADGRPHDHNNTETLGGVPILPRDPSAPQPRPMTADEIETFYGRRSWRRRPA